MIGQALARDALDRNFRAVGIAVAEPDAVIVAEIIFRQVAMQMLLFAVLIDALHAAFEDREETFRRIGVNIAASVFLRGVLDRFV